jgi:hypothetical protein
MLSPMNIIIISNGFLSTAASMMGKITSTKEQISNNIQIQISNDSYRTNSAATRFYLGSNFTG